MRPFFCTAISNEPKMIKQWFTSGFGLAALLALTMTCSNPSSTSNPALSVISPVKASTVAAGDTCLITWNYAGTADAGVIIGLYNDTGLVCILATGCKNNGTFAWTVKSTVPAGNSYQIKISDASNASTFAYGPTFSVANSIDDYEPDNNSAAATPIDVNGNLQHHRIGPDADWFSFSATALKTYCIGIHGSVMLTVNLYSSDAATSIQTGSVPLENQQRIYWTCSTSGKYYFKITNSYSPTEYDIDLRSGNGIFFIQNPNASTSIIQGNSYTVQWKNSSNITGLLSLYAYRGDSLIATIASEITNYLQYSWLVPAAMPASSEYRLKIMSDKDSSVFEYSEKFSITKPVYGLSILYPTSSSRYSSGSTASIQWGYSYSSGTLVGLSLFDSSTFVSTLSTGYSLSSGSFSWIIPNALPTSSKYRIKMFIIADTTVYAWSNDFSITKVPCSLSVYSPAIAAKYNSGTSCQISWYSSGNLGSYASIDLYDSTRKVANLNASAYISNGYFYWTIPFSVPTSSSYRIKITSVTDTGIYAFSKYFSITQLPSAFSITSPTDTTKWNTNSNYVIGWTNTGAAGQYISLKLFDSTYYVCSIVSSQYNSSSTGTLNWLVPYALNSSSKYRIKINGSTDTTNCNFSKYFTITHVPPVLKVTFPKKTDTLVTGTSYNINWTAGGYLGTYAKLELFDSTNHSTSLNSSVIVSYYTSSWVVPVAMLPSTKYRIKITSTSDTTVYAFSDTFTIAKAPTSLTIVKPDSQTTWTSGITNTISWTSSGYLGSYAQISLYDGTAFKSTIASSTSISANSYSWTIPFACPASSNYRIKIASVMDSTIYCMSRPFSVLKNTATTTIAVPSAASVWTAGMVYAINWTSTANFPGTNVSLTLFDSTKESYSISLSTLRSTNYYSWQIPTTLGGNKFRIRIASTFDTTANSMSDYFTIIPVPPKISFSVPNSATSWFVGSSYTISWVASGKVGDSLNIDLYDSLTKSATITTGIIPSTTQYYWNVPPGVTAGNKYRIKIYSPTIDSAFAFSDYFLIANIDDAYEPDERPSQAKPIKVGDPAQLHSLPGMDQDWFSFDAKTQTTYVIETTGNSDTYINLYDSTGSTFVASDNGSGTGLNAKLTWTCQTSGTYDFMVGGVYGSTSTYYITVR